MNRTLPPTSSIDEFLSDREPRNASLIATVRSSGDSQLDRAAFDKTLAVAAAGTMLGPYTSLSHVPVDDPAVAVRKGIWEQHGDAEEASCRNIDDLLHGEQNGTAGTTTSHRPTDADSLIAQTRAVDEFLRTILKG